MTALHDELAVLDGADDTEEVVAATGRRPGSRGWARRGGGRAAYVQPPTTWRGTSVQVCGMWPWAAGSSAPLVGVPLGRILAGRSGSGSTLCCDPLSWFIYGLISRPSAFIEGEPGLGKSALVKRIAMGLAGFGVNGLVLGDTKGEYVAMIRALGGQVIPLGPGRGYLNVLDNSEASEAADRLTGNARHAVLAGAHARRSTAVVALLKILRHRPPEERDVSLVDRCIRVLDDKHDGVPTLPDLLQVLRDAPDEVRDVAIDRGSMDRYHQITESLEASLVALMGNGSLGETFSRHTTEPLRRDRPAVFDISHIDDGQTDLQGAALAACWSAGFGMIEVATALADAGLEPQRNYLAVLDELWRVLGAGPGLVDSVNGLTRLDRNKGVGTIYVTHSLADLNALSEVDRMKARGIAGRAGMVICAGLPREEMPLLGDVIAMSRAEQQLVTGWSSPPAWDTQGRQVAPPGRGNFLVKVGGRPGIPFHVELTEPELALNDTNQRWKQWTERAHGVRA